ncbi:MAG: ArnT family glycosyltransferase [Terriglobia bacterium]
MPPRKLTAWAAIVGVYACLLALHGPLLRLPYFWDEAGYYIPAALDFYHHALLIPTSTQPTGHTPLLSIYLGSLWHLLGFSTLVTRAALVLIATLTVWLVLELGRRLAGTEAGIWSGLLLAISPLFFAQSSLAFLDLAVTLFTTGALLALVEGQWMAFVVAASLAEMSKETAVVMLPVAWAFVWLRRRERKPWVWIALAAPLIPISLWALFYHAKTGFWTGNPQYLQYNLYAALAPLRICRSFLARCEELLVGGFNWFLTLAAIAGLWWWRRTDTASKIGNTEAVAAAAGGRRRRSTTTAPNRGKTVDLIFLAAGLAAVYIGLLSVVGGAILPRYMLPVFPFYILVAVIFILKLPKRFGQAIFALAAIGFIACWFWNPPYPFPYEDNLAYADFIRLHQQAARYLEGEPPGAKILTAWPATDELRQPSLGYVTRSLRIEAIDGFTPRDFADPPAFDLLYLYSRQWEPPHNLILRFPRLRSSLQRFYRYTPQVNGPELISRFHLKLIRQLRRRGQWVRIYAVAKAGAKQHACGVVSSN